ncbi:MAG: Uncharacterized protein AWU57_22 [Marinobacter sp. T13-3]|nr:MAG: Uncharacterized protein AWU57_22 [Marinobacter sp. T13-3]
MVDIFNEVKDVEETMENANQASYASLSTLRIVSKVLGGVLHHSEGLSPDDLEAYSKKMLGHIGEQTTALYQKLEMPPENFVLASITGSVAQVVSDHYRRVGSKALDMKWADVLAEASNLDGVWKEHRTGNHESPDLRRSMAMMEALAPVISAHTRFDYWQTDTRAFMEHVSSVIWHAVDESMAHNRVAQHMSVNEQEMLRANLLRRAGELYADSWDSQARSVLAEYKEAPADQRRAWTVEGYPLTEVDARFQSQYHMLEEALNVSLTVHSGIEASDDQNSGPTLN